MQVYEPSAVADTLLLKWWTEIQENGELEDVFAPSAQTLHGFLSIFQPPTVLFWKLEPDATGTLKVTSAIWFERFMADNTNMGMWVDSRYRHGRWWDDLIEVLRVVFQYTNLVIYMTKRRHVIESGLRVGFTDVGQIPYIYRGQAGWVAYLTKDVFEERYGISDGNRQ